MKNSLFFSFLFLTIAHTSLFSTQEVIATPTSPSLLSSLKTLIVSSTQKISNSFPAWATGVLQTWARAHIREFAGTTTEQFIGTFVSPRSAPEFPLLDDTTYTFIFKSYLRDFLHDYIPKHLKNPAPFFELISFHLITSVEECINQLENACVLYNINTSHLAHEFYYYKHIHGFKDRLKMGTHAHKTFFMYLMGWLAQSATEVTIDSNPTLSWLLVNSFNNTMLVTLAHISLNTFLPIEKRGKGTRLWDYCFKVSKSTLKRAHVIGSLGVLGLNLKQFYTFLTMLIQKIKTGEPISFWDGVQIGGLGLLHTLIITHTLSIVNYDITAFEPPALDNEPLINALQKYSE